MDEARRFLRYVIPGVLFVVEATILLATALPGSTRIALETLLANADVGGAVAALLASGGLGFLFATIHHELHWRACQWYAVIDHSKFINELRERGALSLSSGAASREQALVILTAEWFARSGKGTPIGNANPRAVSLSDLTHSLGTAFVASTCAFLTALLVCSHAVWLPTTTNVAHYCVMLGLGTAFLAVFFGSYRRTGRMTQQYYEYVLQKHWRTDRRRGLR